MITGYKALSLKFIVQEVQRRLFGYKSTLRVLEDRLGLAAGKILAVERRKRPLYTPLPLPLRRRSWKPIATRKTRWVWSPCEELKEVQGHIERLIASRFVPHPIAHAYAKRRSNVTNARQHVGKEWVLHLDLVNFFGSITHEMVFNALRGLLLDFSHEEIGVISRLCCHPGCLPQGSPASPILSNLVCFGMDEQLWALAQRLGLTVTRYSDDIYFSSTSAILPEEIALVRGRGASQNVALGLPLRRIFGLQGFEVNFTKVRFQDRSERQWVTGCVVNDRVNVPREFYHAVRSRLHSWERHGIDIAARRFQPDLSVERFRTSLRGLIDYIGQVKGRNDERYRDFLLSFNELRAGGLANVKPQPREIAGNRNVRIDNVVNLQ
jgi:RNA-directed DNA polymerase